MRKTMYGYTLTLQAANESKQKNETRSKGHELTKGIKEYQQT